MKNNQVVKVLGAITDTGKLAKDMYDLDDKYYLDSKGWDIPIGQMDYQHTIRALIKLQDTNNKLREDLQGGFKQSVDDLDSLEAQEKIIAGLRSQVETLEGIIEEKDELIDRWSKAEHRWRKAYHDSAHTNGHYYTFCEVPQDEEGKEFIKNCKKYLNKESYAIRVKGQHLKKELYGQGRAYHGANMEDSSHMRVYIDKKKGDK